MTGTLTWTGGFMVGPGITTIPVGATLTMSGTAEKDLGREIDNSGTATWTGTGPIGSGNGAIFNNLAGGVFDVQNDAGFFYNCGSLCGTAATFNNAGTFQKTAGTGTTGFITTLFNNTGTVTVQSGTLNLAAGGTGNGSFTGAAGTTLNFGGGTHTLSGAVNFPTVNFNAGTAILNGNFTSTTTNANGGIGNFNGLVTTTGPLVVSAGALNFAATAWCGQSCGITSINQSGGTLSFSATNPLSLPTVTQSAGTFTGAGALTVTGTLTWTGGFMVGPGITTIPVGATLTMSGTAEKDLGREIDNSGTATWTGTGPIGSGNGAIFNNLAGATFVVQNDASFFYNCGSLCGVAATFNNAGTFQKTAGTGTTTFTTTVFNNTGTVSVQSGTLNLAAGGTGSGSFTGAAGTTLIFGGGTHTLSGAVNFPTVNFSAGTANLNGNFTSTATTANGGIGNFNGPVTTTGPLVVSAGALNFSSSAWCGGSCGISSINLSGGTLSLSATNPLSLPTVTQSGGTFTGAGALTVTGTLTWTGGFMVGPGITTIPVGATLTMSGTAEKDLGREIDNSGTATWSGTGNIGSGAGAIFNNLAAGTFAVQNDQSFFYNCGSLCGTAATFNNAGTFQKTAGTGTTTFTTTSFNNTGTIQALSGTISFSAGYTQTAGSVQLNGGNLAASTVNIQGGSLSGAGTITANVTNAGQVSPGSSAGILPITGTYTQTAAGSLNIEIGGLTAGTQFDRLAVSGAATLGGAFNITQINGFAPAAGNSFLVMSYASRSGTFASYNGLNLPGGLAYFVTFNAANLTLGTGVPTADISVTQTDTDPVSSGNNVTYTITVSNLGPSPATGVLLTDTVPPGSTLVSATPSQGSCAGTTVVNCTLGTIGFGLNATVALVVHTTLAGTYVNTATATLNELDPNAANNSSTEGTTVTSGATGPLITTLSPATTTAGGAAFTLTVNGSGFAASPTVKWNGVSRAGAFVNGTQLTAPITAAEIGSTGPALVSMSNLSGAVSNTITFNVTGNIVSTISLISPTTATAGSSGFTLNVSGSGFVAGSVVRWNGSDRVTTPNGTQLQAAILSTDLAAAGTIPVTVFNPGPGGGVSNIVNFTVLANGGTVSAGLSGGLAGNTVAIPISLALSGGVTVDSLSFGLRITPVGAAPALSGSLGFQQAAALAAPTLVDASGAPSDITVSWLPFGAPLSGTTNLGAVSVILPSTAIDGQTYTVQITGVSASLGANAVGLRTGTNATLTVSSTYLVGDASPSSGYQLGQFGDNSLNNFDLIAALRAVTLLPGAVPPSCSDLHDAMDSFPADSASRGGDGSLDNFDLIQTLRRVVGLDTTLPRRPSRGLVCPGASPLAKPSPPNVANAAALLEFGAPQPTRSGGVRMPMYLRVRNDLAFAGLSIGMGVPDNSVTLDFIPSDELPPTVIDNELTGNLAIAWLNAFELAGGTRTLLGYVTGPADLADSLRVFGVVANSADGGTINVAVPRAR